MELKPCPFCGSKAEITKADTDIMAANIVCTNGNCNAKIFYFEDAKTDKRLGFKKEYERLKKQALSVNQKIQRKWNKRV